MISKNTSLIFVLVSSAAVLLSGCSALQPSFEESTLDLPESWANLENDNLYIVNTTDIARLQWWEMFNDSNLSSLIKSGLKANPDFTIAKIRIIQAQEQLISVGADKNPSVDANLRSSKATSSSESSLGRTSTVMNTQFQTSWEFDIFGKFDRTIEASKANLQKKIAASHGVKVRLIADIVESYIKFRSVQEDLKLNIEAAKYLTDFLKLSSLESRVGISSQEEVFLARSRLLNTKTTITGKTSDLKELGMTIDLLIGNSAGDTFNRLMDSKNSLKSPSNIAISIPAETILQRPDIQEALFALQEETAKVGVAEAQRYPSFSFTGSLGLEALTINALGSSSANFSSIQANLLAPIFNSGGLTANVNAQIATRDAALETYKNVISNGLMETEQALVKLLSIKDQLSDISRSVKAGGKHLELTQYKYQSGLVSHRDVLDSLNELNSLKTKQSQIQFSELTSITQLYKTLGGGWAQTVKN